ncbi:Multicopper oxidase with three cupredoxin domains (includes cell division protein FtsP and spore coat protein CotA) [Faunimonas pinastri]|uniref:Multicopper oxidase with three cupredoxin domains (Includes cell division protein FtsP and spore coat protein CotA) n=1 Tax=Faunimonas pinastri TaxID=1855383 RepID=A0A1H9LWB3_9HYPH|nr:multicopper oxidase family protein [Faunimonas pinastri]SER15143.1 Multicopper oxidase with three cupredoxin domains (includes cell division protein FtsP and spore coat protein CotA) [Faunimonas pinastri]
MLTRRHFIGLAGAAAGAVVLRSHGSSVAAPAPAATQATLGELPPESATTVVHDFTYVAAERPNALPCFGGRTAPIWTLSAETPLPVIRIRRGDTIAAHLRNDLKGQDVTIHWHGLRIPNREDGVPNLTQAPVPFGASFDYRFRPPDAGTFFFHTHCNTAEQLGRGLMGVLIVEGDESRPFDDEHILVLRDWSIDENGRFLPFVTNEAARSGTFGNIRSTNNEIAPTYDVPAGADIRLRILNVDRTRIMMAGIEGAEAFVIAIDGNAVEPFPLKTWQMGPAMRIDVAMRSPADGKVARLVDYFAPEPVPLAHFAAHGADRRTGALAPAPLIASPIPVPDLDTAEKLPFTFSQATDNSVAPTGPADGRFIDDLCTSKTVYWAINKQSWPMGDHLHVPPPLATLTRGKSYVFELINVTPHMHPIHFHGHTWKVLKSNKRKHLPVHHADTVLLLPNERVQVAFVADNPGDWMFHCHIIEHQETGMMGYVRVT